MATLADELLNDFEDSGSEAEGEDQQNGILQDGASPPPVNGTAPGSSMVLDGDEEDAAEDEDDESLRGDLAAAVEDEEDAKAKVEKMQLGSVSDVRSVAGLMKTLEPILEVSSIVLVPYPSSICDETAFTCCSDIALTAFGRLQKIKQYQSQPPESQTGFVGSIEDNPEYALLTQSNTLSTSIDNEIILVHKFIRDHYSARFPELERLVQNPLDYAKSVALIGNGPLDKDSIKSIAQTPNDLVGAPLSKVLDGPSLMVVTVEASTSRGQPMAPAELQRVLSACEMTLSLDRAKRTLTDYVQSRMNIFAPNLTYLIGSLTAAQLLSFAGGITGLAKTPACNLAPLGSKKQSQTGFATNVGVAQQGFLYHSPVIRSIPSHLKRQAMRIVSAKIVLAARVDRVHGSPDGSNGAQLRRDCEERLEKLTEPPPNRGPRALPAPDDKPARKRGGRRARKAKEATAMTDLRKEQNRMAFGKEEKEVGYADSSKGMGMIGQQDDGRIRSLKVDQRTRAKLSQKNKGWGGATPVGGGGGVGGMSTSLRGFGQAGAGSGLRTTGVGGGIGGSGTASTIAFTPVQGLELADPTKRAEMKRKADEATDRWFKGGTFTQVGANGGSGGGGGGAKAQDADSFKVPNLPMRKVARTE